MQIVRWEADDKQQLRWVIQEQAATKPTFFYKVSGFRDIRNSRSDINLTFALR